MSGLQRRLKHLESIRLDPADEHEREKRRRQIRETAEQENERFYRNLAIDRRTTYLEHVGHEGHTAEDLRDEEFLYPDDTPPSR